MYIMYMALHIDNPDVERKVRRMASLTGESLTEAIGNAAQERISRRKAMRVLHTPTVDEVLELVGSFKLRRINKGLTQDEVLGYGPDGYCV
jgi:antitoxin VapB